MTPHSVPAGPAAAASSSAAAGEPVGLPSSRPCRHDYRPSGEGEWTEQDKPTLVWHCIRCGRERDEQRARRGRHSLRAGKDAERAIAAAYGGERVGQHGGPADVIVGELFVVQSKAGKGWYRQAVVDELDKLPRTGGLIPTLVVSDRPGPGHRTRRYVVRLMEDDIALHGRQP